MPTFESTMHMRKILMRAAALLESLVAPFQVDLSPEALEKLFPDLRKSHKRTTMQRRFQRESRPQRVSLELLPRTGETTKTTPRQPDEPILFPFPRHRFAYEAPS